MIDRFDGPLTSSDGIFRSLKAGNACVVQTGGQLDPPSWLEDQLGLKMMFPDAGGQTIAWGESQTAFSSPSVKGGWLKEPPVVVGVICTGGGGYECSFVSALRLWKALTTRFSQKEILPLFDSDAVCVRIQSATFYRPAFVKRHGAGRTGIACNFSARLDWHATPSGMARPAFDFCREFVLQDSNQSIYSLKAGECALVPNMMMMNGAMGMPDPGHIKHVWFGNAPTSDLELESFVL